MMISEIFYSIQGEGKLAGQPSVFICMAEGSPRETWCDARQQSWKPETDVMMGQLLGGVRRTWYGYAVITGGEPLNDPELGVLTEGLRTIEHHITIETSGSVYAEVMCDLMSINVHLRNPSKPRKGKAPGYDIDVLRQLIGRYDYQLKFEVGSREEVEEVVHVVREIEADRTKVLLIPAGRKTKDLKEQSAWVAEASRFFGFRYAPRMAVVEAPKAQP